MYTNAAYCYRSRDFEKYITVLRNASKNGACKKLMEVDPKRWARSQCPILRYDFMNSNAAECFNGRLRWGRRLLICTLIEFIRSLVSHWFYEHRKAALERSLPLSDSAIERVDKVVTTGQSMEVEPITLSKFKVSDGPNMLILMLENAHVRSSTLIYFLVLMPRQL